MPRQEQSSRVLDKTDKRIAALMAIAPDLDLGNELTLVAYFEQIETLRERLMLYNRTLSNVDHYHNPGEPSGDIQYSEYCLSTLLHQPIDLLSLEVQQCLLLWPIEIGALVQADPDQLVACFQHMRV